MKKGTPLKRHPAFIAFSKDHHFGLMLVWKIRSGLQNAISVERITHYVLYFFEEDLRHHFREEETLIFSKLPKDDSLRIRAEEEHKNIYSIVEGIRQNQHDKDLLQRFAVMLDDHIRFEERILFNHLQEKWEPAQLEQILLQTDTRDKDCDAGWTDKFWIKDREAS